MPQENGRHDTACPDSEDSRYGKNKVFDTHTDPPVELDGSSVMCRDGIWALLRTKDRTSKKWARIPDYPFLADAPIEGCEKMESTIKILRKALSRVTAGLQHANEGYSEDNFGDEIRAGLAALEATKGSE